MPLLPPPLRRLGGALLLASFAAGCAGSSATVSPAPSDVAKSFRLPENEAWNRAVAAGTRTATGEPGPRYWQQWADYRLEAELNPVAKRLTGRGTVTYFNRSPDTLRVVWVHLYENLYAPDTRKNTDVPWALEGIALTRVAAQGRDLAPGDGKSPGYVVQGTVMRIDLPRPIVPGGTADFAFAWGLRVPPDGAPRGGQDGDAYMINYWYPQIAVYDDVSGWQVDQYYGNAEFYMGYGDYDVSLTLPAGWLVSATGELQNAPEVLTAQTRDRLAAAAHAPAVVHVVTEADRGAGRATQPGTGGKLTWHFRATNVRDVAWGASANYLWDAAPAAVGDRDGDGTPDTTLVEAFWRPEQRKNHWDRSALYAQHSVQFLSRYLWPYPYSHMATMDGPRSCGGMEYPMMTCIGGDWDTTEMYEVTVHEIGHMWFPMQVGSDEKRYAWMDEGLTQFDQSQAMADFFPGFDDEARNREHYLQLAQVGGEVELMRHGDRYPTYLTYGVATYYKTATILVALRAVLGKETFERAYREYGRRWLGKHPDPWDFWHTFENVSGRDLTWFWRTWFYETWTLDQAIDTVVVTGDSVDVVVGNRGRAPMPVLLAITREGGRVDRVTLPVEAWFGGAKRQTLRVSNNPAVTKVVIDPGQEFPDLDRSNQAWPR